MYQFSTAVSEASTTVNLRILQIEFGSPTQFMGLCRSCRTETDSLLAAIHMKNNRAELSTL